MKYTFGKYKRLKRRIWKGPHVKRMCAHFVMVDDGQPLQVRRSLEREYIKNWRYRQRREIIYQGPIGRLLGI